MSEGAPDQGAESEGGASTAVQEEATVALETHAKLVHENLKVILEKEKEKILKGDRLAKARPDDLICVKFHDEDSNIGFVAVQWLCCDHDPIT